MYSLPNIEPLCCSMSGTNCCFLTCIQVSQEAGKVVWYSHLFQNFSQFSVIHTIKGFSAINEAEVGVVNGSYLLIRNISKLIISERYMVPRLKAILLF